MKNIDAGKHISQTDRGVKHQDACLFSEPSGKKYGRVACQTTGQGDIHITESQNPELGERDLEGEIV